MCVCTDYILYIQYMVAYFASLHELLQHNTVEYFYSHYLTLMTCTKCCQPELHSPDSNCW